MAEYTLYASVKSKSITVKYGSKTASITDVSVASNDKYIGLASTYSSSTNTYNIRKAGVVFYTWPSVTNSTLLSKSWSIGSTGSKEITFNYYNEEGSSSKLNVIHTVSRPTGTTYKIKSGASWETTENGFRAPDKSYVGYTIIAGSRVGITIPQNDSGVVLTVKAKSTSTYSQSYETYLKTYSEAGAKKDGYTFKNWKCVTTGSRYDGNSYESGRHWSVSTGYDSSITTYDLYATWTANQYTITLDNQSASSAGTTSVTATYDSAMPSITIPAKTGYTFQGYFTSTGGTGTKYYNPDGSSARTWNIASTSILYAYWTPNVYSVTLSPNGGTWPSGSITTIYRKYGVGFYSDQACTKGITGITTFPTWSGHIFAGFYSSSSGGIQYLDSTGKLTSSASNKTNGNYTWFAQWEDGIEVTFNCNGGSYNGSSIFTKIMRLTTQVKDSSISGMTTRDGYIFDGFYTTTSGGTQVWKWNSYNSIVPDTAASNFWSGVSTTSTWKYGSNVTLYAHWSRANIYAYYNNAWHPVKYVYAYNSGWKRNQKNDNNAIKFYAYNSGWEEGKKN